MKEFIKFQIENKELAISIVTCEILDIDGPACSNVNIQKESSYFMNTSPQKLFVRYEDSGKEGVIHLGNELFYARPGHRLALIHIGHAGDISVDTSITGTHPEQIRTCGATAYGSLSEVQLGVQ
ncbi:MAG: hypothetical protein LBR22_04590 [Desulfovibrio sp.]|jgi:hypothetical protein|nr:hypothetical protein [Desulfovibrio sp.]